MAEKSNAEIADELRAEYRAAIRRTAEEEASQKRGGAFAGGKKSIRRAYLLWTLLGSIGAHRLYLGRPATGAAMLALTLVGSISTTQPEISTLAWPIGIGVFIWWLWDAFQIPKMLP
jgi:TM2 domain-containing membrane protein YozV